MFNIQDTITETTWVEVKERADAGKIQSGERFTFSLKTAEQVTVQATHDANGRLFFVLEDCLEDEHAMNRTSTNKGGWAASDMRKYLNKTVFALLPDDLQEFIKPTTVVQILDGKRVKCEDKLFLLSETQVFGKGDYTEYEPKDTQLDIFRREKCRVKEYGDHGTWFWWLRSPLRSSSFCFFGITSAGTSVGSSAADAAGVAFGFSL